MSGGTRGWRCPEHALPDPEQWLDQVGKRFKFDGLIVPAGEAKLASFRIRY
jgi:hypothetical protein